MGFRLDEFLSWSPYLYHITRIQNVEGLRHTRTLQSAGELLRLGRRLDLLRVRRANDIELDIDGRVVVIRNQARLVLGSLSLPSDVTVDDYVEYLNRWVYLWPGSRTEPRGRAKGLSASDDGEVASIRFLTRDVLSSGAPRTLYFCDRNSGAARHHSGARAERHLRMHRTSGLFRGVVKDVVEIAIDSDLPLPTSTEVQIKPGGRWETL